jgi:hypothetical protein
MRHRGAHVHRWPQPESELTAGRRGRAGQPAGEAPHSASSFGTRHDGKTQIHSNAGLSPPALPEAQDNPRGGHIFVCSFPSMATRTPRLSAFARRRTSPKRGAAKRK